MMTTKMFGVSMEDIKKLREFQFLLRQKKFGMQVFDKMECLAYVQLTSETILIPQIIRIGVVNTSIHIDDGSTIIAKCRILKIVVNNNQVIVKLKRSLVGFGSFLSFDFTNGNQKEDFLNAIGEIVDNESDSDSGQDVANTPPNSESSSDDNL